jgi:5'-methylthioadenosine phosphorylase
MTNMPEARLAREAELCYATIAMVTDYDCWRGSAASVPDMLRIFADNLGRVRRILASLIADFPREHPPCAIGSDRALEHALVTPAGSRDPALVAKLDAVAGRVLAPAIDAPG